MLRRKQFELFTYLVIDLWIIRALRADLAAYRVVHSSSSFSLVLLITTIITKKLGSCSLVPFDILPNVPWFFKNPWGTLTDPGPHKIWNSSLGCCPLFFALLVFCRHQLEMAAQLCFKIVVFLLYFSSWRTILREFHCNCYQLSQSNRNFQSCHHTSLGLKMSRDNMPSFNLLKANKK